MRIEGVGDAWVVNQGVQFGAEYGCVPRAKANLVFAVQRGQPLAEGQILVETVDFPLAEHFIGVIANLALDAGAQRFQMGRRDGLADMMVAVPFVGVRHCSILLLSRICLGL